jgi:hypothetical protein
MANYYVPKKNRCPCYEGGGSTPCVDTAGANYTKTNFFYIPNNSSMNMLLKRSNQVYTSSLNESTTKGQGNIKKQGSGGNSYVSYLSRKVGKQGCVQC